jgi:hypothetical protein
MDDREYMHQRYRDRGGARSLPIWRERHGRMEFDEADLVASSYGRHRQHYPDRALAGSPSQARRKNLIAAGLLAVIGALYLVFTGTSGSLFSGQPKNGEFRVRSELQAGPTATLIFTAGDKPVAMHLLDTEDREIFVAYIRAKRTAKLQVPAGRWHTIVTSGTATSLSTTESLTDGQPLGMIDLPAGSKVSLKPSNITSQKGD